VLAANQAARAGGVEPGIPLADARALLPGLAIAEADPAADRQMLERLADWCGRYTPWTAVDENGGHARGSRLLETCFGGRREIGGGAGLWLDVSGCAHLFGGEQALLDDLVGRFAGVGFAAAAALADTPGAAWAVARLGLADPASPQRSPPERSPPVDGRRIAARHPRSEHPFAGARPPAHPNADTPGQAIRVVPPGGAEAAVAPLPVAALRLPTAVVEGLDRVGLRRVGDPLGLPRAPLAARFGDVLLDRLDQALGATDEPLSPRRPVAPLRARLPFVEPIGRAEDVALATRTLLDELCNLLAAGHQGARRLELALYRTDATVARAVIGTGRPVCDAGHLERLFRDKLDGLDAGFGVEVMTLAALAADPLPPEQTVLDDGTASRADGIAQVADRLGNRLGPGTVVRLAEHASHVPERACREVAALAPAAGAPEGPERSRQPRPLHLLPSPEPIEVIAPVPDGPPVMVRWRRAQLRIAAADGPERIGPEWWRADAGHDPEHQSRVRDYYRIEDADGRRFWVFREGLYRADTPPRWYLHGVFQ